MEMLKCSYSKVKDKNNISWEKETDEDAVKSLSNVTDLSLLTTIDLISHFLNHGIPVFIKYRNQSYRWLPDISLPRPRPPFP